MSGYFQLVLFRFLVMYFNFSFRIINKYFFTFFRSYFSSLTKLETLELQKNDLTHFEMDLKLFPSLKKLDLRDNNLKFIDCSKYKNITKTTNILMGEKTDLSKLQKASIFCKSTNDLIQNIAILPECPRHCKCTQVKNSLTIKCENLQQFPFVLNQKSISSIYLDLDNNTLTTLEPLGEQAALDKIVEISAKNNQIKEFCFELFTNNVAKIDVRNNLIESIDDDSVKILTQRKKNLILDLIGNAIVNDSAKISNLMKSEIKIIYSNGISLSLSINVVFIGIFCVYFSFL